MQTKRRTRASKGSQSLKKTKTGPQNTLKHPASKLLDHGTQKTPYTTNKKLEKPPTMRELTT